MRVLPILAVAACLLSLGCGHSSFRMGMSVGPDFESPEVETPAAFKGKGGKAGAIAKRDDWWTVFRSQDLNRLVEQARAENNDLAAALKRIEQTQAVAKAVRAGAIPQATTSPSFQRSRNSAEILNPNFPGPIQSETINLWTLPANLDWELDLFGRIRRSSEAAEAETALAEEDLNDLKLVIEAQVARIYYNIRALDEELRLVRGSVDLRQQLTDLVQKRFDLGLVSGLDVAQAETQLRISEADAFGLNQEREALENALATLCGQPASKFELPSRPIKGRPPSTPVGLPSELLLARPDIRRALRLLEAENARIGVAQAAFYPTITVTGAAGLQASDFSNLFDGGARYWAVGPSIFLPLFQGGLNRANLARAKARYEEVMENYQQAVLLGLEDVETGLSDRRNIDLRIQAQGRAVAAAQRARDLSAAQYENGAINYLALLDAERTALDLERQFARLQGLQYAASIDLIRSLGGRW